MPSGSKNATKTHCPKGHPYYSSNLYINPQTGSRQCRECRRTNRRQWMKSIPEKSRIVINENHRRWRENNREVANASCRRISRDKRAFLAEVVGAACVDCGDDRPGAIQYHHSEEPKSGRFQLINLSWPKLKEEAMHLIALCGACHGVRHHKENSL